ncbi:hypothetical protein KQX54_005325 [Cotesia glomerata]|uniref:Uncharacterized protein n=1 Tax=Cotesia glomerata TaxID=32391 RepID=A0AAV7J4F1_COTGL|nr:hypothetical protein KQX54_005325 [Cotesia glomerata]
MFPRVSEIEVTILKRKERVRRVADRLRPKGTSQVVHPIFLRMLCNNTVDYGPETKRWQEVVYSSLRLPRAWEGRRGVCRCRFVKGIVEEEAEGGIKTEVANPCKEPLYFLKEVLVHLTFFTVRTRGRTHITKCTVPSLVYFFSSPLYTVIIV